MDQDRDATLEFNLSHSHRSGRHSTPSRADEGESDQRLARRSRSLSPGRQRQGEGLATTDQRVADLQRLLELKVSVIHFVCLHLLLFSIV